MSESTDVTAVDNLDLDRYLGLWYEIARKPLRYEDTEATDITAHYSLDDDGQPTQALGRATVGDSPSKLEVTFLPEALRWIPFTKADYWVLKIDADYRHALVGTPDRKYLWLLARAPQVVDPATEQEFLAEATRQGFDLADLIRPAQSGGRVSDEDLARDA